MLKHSEIWRAIDRLAQANDLSPSGLARQAGLDPTTFNKSKRKTAAGRLRWPSSESLAKILEATGTSPETFLALAGESQNRVRQRIPVIGYAQAGAAGYFDDAGFPTGTGWDEINFPQITDETAYALEISGDSMAPMYRDGDLIIVSPTSTIRRGDRVVLRTRDGEVTAKILKRRTATRVELGSLNPLYPDRSLAPGEVAWMARILWASQ